MRAGMHFWLIFVPQRQQVMLGRTKLLLYYTSFDTQLLSSVLLRVHALLHKSVFLLSQTGHRNPRLRIAVA